MEGGICGGAADGFWSVQQQGQDCLDIYKFFSF